MFHLTINKTFLLQFSTLDFAVFRFVLIVLVWRSNCNWQQITFSLARWACEPFAIIEVFLFVIVSFFLDRKSFVTFSDTARLKKNCVAVGHGRCRRIKFQALSTAPHLIIVAEVINKRCELNISIDTNVCCFDDNEVRKLFCDPLGPCKRFWTPTVKPPKRCLLFICLLFFSFESMTILDFFLHYIYVLFSVLSYFFHLRFFSIFSKIIKDFFSVACLIIVSPTNSIFYDSFIQIRPRNKWEVLSSK